MNCNAITVMIHDTSLSSREFSLAEQLTSHLLLSVVWLRLCLLWVQNKERMHLKQCSIITTSIFSSTLWKQKKISTKRIQITDFHSQRGSATKMTLIPTQTWKRMRSRMHMLAMKIGNPESGRLFALHCYQCAYAVGCVCVHLHACVNSA